MANGSRHSLRYVPELEYGVTPATPAFQTLRHTSTTLALSKGTLQSNELRSDRQIADFRHGARQVGGDIGFELSYGTYDALLEALLCGTWEDDVLHAGVERRSFTFERLFGDMATAESPFYRFTGVELNTLALTVGANAMVTGTFGTLGMDMTTAQAEIAGATYALPTTTAPLDSFTGELLEKGVPNAVVTEVSLTIDNGLAVRNVVGRKTTIRPSIGRSTITGQVTAFFENSTLVNKFINETESSITFTLPDAAGNSYEFTLPRIKYTGGQPDVSGEGPITLSMPIQALVDAETGTNIIIRRIPAGA